MFSINAAVELIKIISAYTSPLFIESTFLLFCPDNIMEKIGLLSFRNENKSIIGVVFVVTISFILSFILKKPITWFKTLITVNLIKANLKKLTPDEKAVLSKYITNQTQSQHLSIMDGLSHSLVSKGILYRASVVGSLGRGFAYNMQPYAYKYLQKNRELLNNP